MGEAGVCGPPPRDVRGLVKKTPTTELDQQPVRAAQQLSVKTTFNYQLQQLYQQLHEPEDKTIRTIKKDADRSRLLLISKFCYVSTFKSGFQHILPSICHHQHICNIINLQTHFFLF